MAPPKRRDPKGAERQPSAVCPACGHQPAAVVYETAASVYFVCPTCEHTWQQHKESIGRDYLSKG